MNIFDTLTLLGMVESLDRPRRFILDLFFSTGVVNFNTAEIFFDRIATSRKIAPFVSPLLQGKVMAQPTNTASSFRPAYVKPKNIVTPGDQFYRRPGEPIGGGSMTPIDRFNDAVLRNLEDQDRQIARREELMAIEIMRTGKVIVESPEFPRMLVDYVRPNGHTVALTSGDRWGETNVKPLANIKTWARTVHGTGTSPNIVVMDPLAADLFLADASLTQILDNRRQADGEMQLAGAATGAQGSEAVRLGVIGQFEFWQYQQTYQDENGAEQKMMPDYTVLMGSKGIEGYMTYGAIQDINVMRALDRFPKMWEQEDPSVAFVMTQSAPLPVPMRVSGSFAATVR